MSALGDPPGLIPRRRMRRGWMAFGVLAIVLSALGSATLFRALGPSGEYLAVARDVPAGAQVTRADLIEVRLPGAPGLAPVPAREADRVLGMYATVPLAAGTLVSLSQLTDERVPGPGEQLVAVPLARDQVPGRTLRPGDPVLLVATTGGQAAGGRGDEPPRTFAGRVHDVQDGGARGGTLVVSVLVAERDGASVASLAAAGRVAVVLVPGAAP
jgi:hypothetical protein